MQKNNAFSPLHLINHTSRHGKTLRKDVSQSRHGHENWHNTGDKDALAPDVLEELCRDGDTRLGDFCLGHGCELVRLLAKWFLSLSHTPSPLENPLLNLVRFECRHEK